MYATTNQCDVSTAQKYENSVFQRCFSIYRNTKAVLSVRTLLLADDGKGEGTGILPVNSSRPGKGGYDIHLYETIGCDENNKPILTDAYKLVEQKGYPHVAVVPKALTRQSDHQSIELLESECQSLFLRNKEYRGLGLNTEKYTTGQRSDWDALCCGAIYIGAVQAVLNKKLFFNSYIPAEIKMKLRLQYPELNDHKYWRKEATNACERQKQYTRDRRSMRRTSSD